jgi:hypothetical protein
MRLHACKNAKWFAMKTSGSESKTYRKYGVLTFKIHDTSFKLNIYQLAIPDDFKGNIRIIYSFLLLIIRQDRRVTAVEDT